MSKIVGNCRCKRQVQKKTARACLKMLSVRCIHQSVS